MPRVRTPADIAVAVRMYYEKISLGNAEIKELFGITSSSTVSRYKREVVEYFAKKDMSPYCRSSRLDTYRAYEAWGLDINDLEKRLKKLQKLKEIM